jgi:FkbM family methyltransferase
MIQKVKVKEGLKKVLKYDLTEPERMWTMWEVCYGQIYFPRLSHGILDYKIEDQDVVIDIGANVGLFSVLAANLAHKGRVYSFEPVRENFERLNSNIKLNDIRNITTENKGVSDKKKKATIHLIEHSGGHSLSLNKIKLLQEKTSATQKIECISLKDVFDKYKIKRCNFLKLDCEGEEYKILTALPPTYFERIDKIALEFHHPVVDELKLAKHLVKNNFNVTISNFGGKLGMIYAMGKRTRKERGETQD